MGLCKKYRCVGRAGRWLGGPGRVVLTLKTPYRDGTTHIAMSLLELTLPRWFPVRGCI